MLKEFPRLRQVLADNPSPMTHHGTNTYLLGSGDVALIDPGPDLESHFKTILATLDPSEQISHIFVTHSHLDHSALAPRLAKHTGAEVFAFGPSGSGRSAFMESIARNLANAGGEGVDRTFAPTQQLSDGQTISGKDWELHALHTPGHMSNHLSFRCRDTLFCGDHVMGWSTSLVSPPDGDMGAYMRSLNRLRDQNWGRMLPGHGAPIETPDLRLSQLYDHRKAREAAIRTCLQTGANTIREITKLLYSDTPKSLWPAAERSVFAHLLDMIEQGVVAAEGSQDPYSSFTLN